MAARDDVRDVLARLDTTGCVVTTAHDGQLAGCFATFLTACSMEPARLLVCTSHENLTHELVERSGVLAVHPVARGQDGLLRHFGLQSGRDVDKFAALGWRAGETGAPLLDDALGYVEGRVVASLPCGDHTARLVEPVAAALRDSDVPPLRMFEVLGRHLDPREPRHARPWTEFSPDR